jgi:hypothetical protein
MRIKPICSRTIIINKMTANPLNYEITLDGLDEFAPEELDEIIGMMSRINKLYYTQRKRTLKNLNSSKITV